MESGMMNMKKRSRISEDEEDNNYVIKRRKQEEEQEHSKYGDGMAWVRGGLIGKGCFGSVFLATLKKPKLKYSSYPPIMAVKSAEVSVSSSIQKEKEVLNNIRGCRNVIRCFGDEITNGDNGQMVYNLLLEYGSGGTLAHLINKSGNNGLPESEVKRHTRSIVRGLRHIHRCGYVHCDLKPENILLIATNSVANRFTAKIGDLGLAKRAKQAKKGKLIPYWRGTPMYLSPEAVNDNVQEPPSDIWAVGCIVLEMLTANPPWIRKSDAKNVHVPTPRFDETLSSEAKSFLKGCFARKSMYRLTADMLLAHPFLEGINDLDEDDDNNNNNNNNNVDDTGDAFDINAITSLVTSENENEDGFSSLSDGFCLSEEEDVDGTENDTNSCYSVEEETSTSTAAAPLNNVHQYPITFTISSGV